MAEQVRFFRKNKLDITNTVATLTASQGNDYTDFLRNRNNRTAWATTGSADADLTNIVVDFVDTINLDFILLVKHNFKAYTIQYWNGATYVDFSTAISETVNTATTTIHEFTEVYTTKIKLIIQGTMVADDDKYLYQLIASTSIGQLNGWPVIKSPKYTRSRQISKTISGKASMKEQLEAFSCELEIKVTSDSTDLALIESLYASNSAFLVWLCGGDQTQFSSARIGYRLQDIHVMKPADDLEPEWYKGLYQSGMKVGLKLVEVVD